jgi:two-component system phosphate regulon response regulator PhoB
VDGRQVQLTPGECRLLACLLAEPGRAFSRRELVRAASGEAAVAQRRVVDTHVKELRRKLGRPDLIQAVRGVGYRLEEG